MSNSQDLNHKPRIILGVDPGLQNTGLGLISINQQGVPTYITHTVLQTKPSHSLETRLNTLFSGLNSFILSHTPSIMVIEEIFASVNSNTIIKLGMARALPVLCAGIHKCSLFNVPTRLIKKKIAGKGNAEKDEVATSVCKMLNIPHIISQDATDALACALYMM